MSNNDERRSYSIDEELLKDTATMSCRMAVHMDLETQLPSEACRRIIGMFQPYWRGDVSFNQLLAALSIIGYGKDLDVDGLHRFINKGDLH